MTKIDEKTILTGAEIRTIREELGWTQDQMGKKLNVTGRRISQMEREAPPASIEMQDTIKQRYEHEWKHMSKAEAEPEKKLEAVDALLQELHEAGLIQRVDEDVAVCVRPGCTNPADSKGNHLCKTCRARAGKAGQLRHLARALQRRDPAYAAGLEIEAILVRFDRDEWGPILAKVLDRLGA